jgi:DNA-binding beta-propeller fold protein YncE
MAVSADGSRLFVADPSSGGVAVIDPEAAIVLNSVTVDLQSLRTDASASASPDGMLYLAGRHEVLVMDGTSLEIVRSLHIRPAISGITVGNDGRTLYAGVEGGVIRLDSHSGRVTQRAAIRGVREVVGRT